MRGAADDTVGARLILFGALNPEPRPQCGTGDCAAPSSAELVEMHESHNARRLGALITRLLPV
ncbi:hypothetical protein [Streptomyces sp. TP-A0356]|uniref:hypothetical protein n=1 Tax=Streptomyces sp. TP-A0356 TaxID=1359208 RepID=UPI0006E43B44|nr:hypothetical protein [Streptomyces sp. TP-A0356]